jgi:hypothetical protein
MAAGTASSRRPPCGPATRVLVLIISSASNSENLGGALPPRSPNRKSGRLMVPDGIATTPQLAGSLLPGATSR